MEIKSVKVEMESVKMEIKLVRVEMKLVKVETTHNFQGIEKIQGNLSFLLII